MDPSISTTISIDLTNDDPIEPSTTVMNNITNINNENNDKGICITEVTTPTSFNNNCAQISTPSIVQSMQTKSHVVPTVYFQLPSTGNKTATNNVILNTVQISNINNLNNKNSNLTSGITLPTNTNVLNKTQQIVIQKPLGNTIQAIPVVPVAVSSSSVTKSTVAYLTMIQPMAKTNENLNRAQLNKNKTDNIHILPKTSSTNTNNSQKFVIAPMPKITSNRLPITATTNCVQSKIAFMPLSLTNNLSNSIQPKQYINVKLSDGNNTQQNDNNRTITVMCDSTAPDKDEISKNTKEKLFVEMEENKTLLCNEVITIDSPEKKSIEDEDKSYQLSIIEDSNNSINDVHFPINKTEDLDKTKHDTQFNDTPKFAKHGISILKRTFSLSDRKVDQSKNSLIISPVPSLITTISDANTKEVKITTSSSFESEDPIIITPAPFRPQKSERRRKSQFSYRKDYDEIEVTSTVDWDSKQTKFDDADVTLTKLDENDDCETVISNDKHLEDLVEIEVIKENMDINMNDDNDISKILNWDDDIGTLPGSDLKFKINEFGLLEYITKDDYKKLVDKKCPKIKEKGKNDEEYCCNECGCYGTLSEFINTKYCSYDCQEVSEKEIKVKRKKRGPYNKKSDRNNDVVTIKERESTPSEEENTSNENSQDKYNYPWNCTKKGFSWAKYLEHIKAKAAPVKLFKDAFPYSRNSFRPGMKLEGVDPQHPSYFCVLSVAEVIGYRLRLHFDGYSDNYDFWLNADSMDIFPAGWCEKYGHTLHPPFGCSIQSFNWAVYLKQTRSSPAPKHLFSNRAGNSICPNGFRVGMKLEAVDRKNTSLICVATVTDMMDNRILVHFDSWDDIYDYWADPSSPYIHPVGWCDQYGHNLTPPNGYPNPETFTWDKYLKETKGVAAPVRAFKQRQVNGFKKGMRLECVDRRVPQLIRAATVDDVREHQIRISFDGWPDRYSYWVDDDSPDIHPVTWCQKTGHPLEPPLTPDDVYDFLDCATIGCRGIGHIHGPKLATHSSTKHCPYAEENIDIEKVLPDRLLSPDRQIDTAVPVQREPKDKIKTYTCKKARIGPGRPPKFPKLEPMTVSKNEWSSHDFNDKKLKRKYKKLKSESPEMIKRETSMIFTNGYTNVEQQQAWEKHSKYLTEYIKYDSDPRDWSEDEVVEFVTSIPSCKDHGNLFNKHNIDGESLLMLSQTDLVDILKIKLGPAIKLYNCIILLRQNISKGYT